MVAMSRPSQLTLARLQRVQRFQPLLIVPYSTLTGVIKMTPTQKFESIAPIIIGLACIVSAVSMYDTIGVSYTLLILGGAGIGIGVMTYLENRRK